MFNPYIKFEERLINTFIERQKFFLVSQTLKYRTLFNEEKTPILLSHYSDAGLAILHKKAVQNDPYASLIDLRKEPHIEKIKEMLQPASKYDVWAFMVEDREKTEACINKKYAYNIRNWITRNTNWHIAKWDAITPHLNFIFGEMFIVLKYGNQTKQVALSEIEKY